MSEEELSILFEEFETVSEIKDFFEHNCTSKTVKPFDLNLLSQIQKDSKRQKSYCENIKIREIMGINEEYYHLKTPLYLIHHEENSDNALKAYMNNPEALFEHSHDEKLSFILIKDKEGKNNYFLDQKANHRVTILLILSDMSEELYLKNVKVTQYQSSSGSPK